MVWVVFIYLFYEFWGVYYILGNVFDKVNKKDMVFVFVGFRI